MDMLGIGKFGFGSWTHSAPEDFSANQPNEWAEMGMTLTMMHKTNAKSDVAHCLKMLDCAAQNGIKVILCDDRTRVNNLRRNGREQHINDVKKVLETFKMHPAIWAVHIGDEPKADGYASFCEAAKIVKSLAPDIRPYGNLLPWFDYTKNFSVYKLIGTDDYPAYLNKFVADSGMELLSFDCYAQMLPGDFGYDQYFRTLRYFSDASVKNNVLFFAVLLALAHMKYRVPNIDDFRWQISTSAAHGVKAVLWYMVYQSSMRSNYRCGPVNALGRKTQAYYDLSDCMNLFNNHLGLILPRLNFVKTMHVAKAYGGNELFTGDEICFPAPPKYSWGDGAFGLEPSPMIYTYFTDDAGRPYIMVTNNSPFESVHHTVCLRGESRRVFVWQYGGGEKEMKEKPGDDGAMRRENGITTVPAWYAPGQALLFRYE